MLPRPAPRWHLDALIALIVGVAVLGSIALQPRSAANGYAAPRLPEAYLTLLTVDAALVAYVARVGRGRWVLSELVGRLPRRGELRGDLFAAALGWAVIEAADAILRRLGPTTSDRASSLLPDSPATLVAWLGLTLVIAFSEEVVFRGYLRIELERWSRRAWIGIVGQAALFGLAHLDQGVFTAGRVCFYGVVLALIARRRGSLVPAILCHAGIDAWAGLAHC